MNTRRLIENDLGKLLVLYEDLHSSDEPTAKFELLQSTWKEIMCSDRYQYFGFFINDALLASCALTVIPNLSRGCKPYGLIENVVTSAKYRKLGYGKAVLLQALASAWSANCYKVMLMTGRKDAAILKFYTSVGFDSDEKHAFVVRPAV